MDELFLEQLRQGRPAAFEILVDEFEVALYRMFLCDHRDHHTAQEQTAETFAQLVHALPNMRGGPEKLRAFVFGVARHVQQRRWRMKKTKSAQIGIEMANEVPDQRLRPPDEAVAREEYDSVIDTIGQFEQPLRSVLLFRFVEECSLEEIAEALDLPIGTVKSHIHRGRTRLRSIFVQQECRE